MKRTTLVFVVITILASMRAHESFAAPTPAKTITVGETAYTVTFRNEPTASVQPRTARDQKLFSSDRWNYYLDESNVQYLLSHQAVTNIFRRKDERFVDTLVAEYAKGIIRSIAATEFKVRDRVITWDEVEEGVSAFDLYDFSGERYAYYELNFLAGQAKGLLFLDGEYLIHLKVLVHSHATADERSRSDQFLQSLSTLEGINLPPLTRVRSNLQANGGLIQQVPNDGTWVRYHMSAVRIGPGVISLQGSLMLRFLGTDVVNGRTYRWIEFEFNGEDQSRMKKIHTVTKALVLAQDLTDRGEGPITVLRAWNRSPDNMVQREDGLGIYTNWLVARLNHAAQLNLFKNLAVEGHFHRIPTALRGATDARPSAFGLSAKCSQTVWILDEVPVGCAVLEIEEEVTADGKHQSSGRVEFVVEAFGSGAESVLPSHN